MKTRDFRTRKAGCYGPAWERVRRLPCFWLRFQDDHVCGPGHTGGHTAHHFIRVGRGGRDQDGLIPCCGWVHDVLHGWGDGLPKFGGVVAMEMEVQRQLGKSLAVIAVEYFKGEECGYDLGF